MRIEVESLFIYRPIPKRLGINRAARYLVKNRLPIGGQAVMAYVRLKALDEEAQSIGSVVIGWQESGDAPFQGPPFSISFLKSVAQISFRVNIPVGTSAKLVVLFPEMKPGAPYWRGELTNEFGIKQWTTFAWREDPANEKTQTIVRGVGKVIRVYSTTDAWLLVFATLSAIGAAFDILNFFFGSFSELRKALLRVLLPGT